MKQNPSLLVFVLLLSAGLYSCGKPQAPEYQGLENIRITQTTPTDPQVSADVKLYNPNRFNLQLRRAEVDIYLNDQLSGHSSLDSTINIPKADTFYIPVALNLDLKKLLGNALQILLQREVKVRLEGRAWLKRGGIPFSVPFRYEGKEPISSFMQ